jgi:hypothetical protein
LEAALLILLGVSVYLVRPSLTTRKQRNARRLTKFDQEKHERLPRW